MGAEDDQEVSVTPRPHPEAFPHGKIQELFRNVYFVKGKVVVSKGVPMTMRFSRNMTIVRIEDSNELVIINSIRLSEEGMKELDELGKVTHVIRVAGYHGMDDPFYKERYSATIWVQKGSIYSEGFEHKTNTPYFQADVFVETDPVSKASSPALPIPNAQWITIPSASVPESLILIPVQDKQGETILISGDSLQNYKPSGDEYFGFLTKIMMTMMGFMKSHNIGPVWYSSTKPDKEDLVALLDLKFDHLLPAHGEPCIGQAFEKFEPAIRALKPHDNK